MSGQGQRFPRAERLRGRGAFRAVYDNGRRFPGTFMVLIVLTSPAVGRRVGFVTSRKVGSAVQRNRARRHMREAYRRLRAEMTETGNHAHYVFVARTRFRDAGYHAIFDEMRSLFREADVVA